MNFLLTNWSIDDRLTTSGRLQVDQRAIGGDSVKKKIIKFCKIIPIVLLVCFAISVTTGYARYSSTLNSAPFSVWVLVDAIYFILPGIILWITGIVLQKRWKE